MKLLAIYILACAIGCGVGVKLKKQNREIKWSGKVQTGLIIILLTTMGCRLGANREVISSIGKIGLSAFIITIGAMAGSVLMVMIARKLLRFNKKGESIDD